MKKTIYLLAILSLFGSAWLGVKNRQELGRVEAGLVSVAKQKMTVTTALSQKEEERDVLLDSKSKVRDTKQQISAILEDKKRELARIQNKIESRQTERKELELQKDEFDIAIRKLYRGQAIQSIEQLNASRDGFEDSLSSLHAQIGRITEEIGFLEARTIEQTMLVGIEEEYQLDRNKKVVIGQLQGTVIAINSDWGFVIVNAGESHGIGTSSTFLVKRGKQRVGRLMISHLRENVSLCKLAKSDEDIDTIQLGDSVIVEDPS